MTVSEYVKNKIGGHSFLPGLLHVFLCVNPKTVPNEILGQSLKKAFQCRCESVPSVDKLLKEFIEEVCKWGGGWGYMLKDKILNKEKNTPKFLRETFQCVCNLKSDEQIVAQAIRDVQKINGLGQSFGSKHLRFLFPEYCPVLDGKLREKLDYKESYKAYAEFSEHCGAIADKLTAQNKINPFPGRENKWYPGDVEAAIFAHVKVKGWNACPPMNREKCC